MLKREMYKEKQLATPGQRRTRMADAAMLSTIFPLEILVHARDPRTTRRPRTWQMLSFMRSRMRSYQKSLPQFLCSSILYRNFLFWLNTILRLL